MRMIVIRGSGDKYLYHPELAKRDDIDVVDVDVELDKNGKPVVGADGHYVVKSQKPAAKEVAKPDANVQVTREE